MVNTLNKNQSSKIKFKFYLIRGESGMKLPKRANLKIEFIWNCGLDYLPKFLFKALLKFRFLLFLGPSSKDFGVLYLYFI